MSKEIIVLQQDGRQKLEVQIPSNEVEAVIKINMGYRSLQGHGTYLKRLYKEGSANFNDFIEKVYPRFGAK